MFDLTLAVAALDVTSDAPDLTSLRARYPELSFLLDRMEDLLDSAAAHEHAMADLKSEHEQQVDNLTEVMADVRDMLLSDGAKALRAAADALDDGVRAYG
jgi:ElaB/YqjD/DUF883 family membrane-anchored ribosome-binding protein